MLSWYRITRARIVRCRWRCWTYHCRQKGAFVDSLLPSSLPNHVMNFYSRKNVNVFSKQLTWFFASEKHNLNGIMSKRFLCRSHTEPGFRVEFLLFRSHSIYTVNATRELNCHHQLCTKKCCWCRSGILSAISKWSIAIGTTYTCLQCRNWIRSTWFPSKTKCQ